MLITPMTELEAVNEMLLSIGQAPVSTLAVPGIRDVSLARGHLAAVATDLQLEGWHWNTDESYSFAPDLDGYIKLPPGVLRLDPKDRAEAITMRRRPGTEGTLNLYDRATHSFRFTAPVIADVTWGFSFEDLPEVARRFVAISAARKFQAKTIGSAQLDGFGAEDEAQAWRRVQKDERSSRNTNLFRRNRSMQRMYNRRGSAGTTYP